MDIRKLFARAANVPYDRVDCEETLNIKYLEGVDRLRYELLGLNRLFDWFGICKKEKSFSLDELAIAFINTGICDLTNNTFESINSAKQVANDIANLNQNLNFGNGGYLKIEKIGNNCEYLVKRGNFRYEEKLVRRLVKD